MIIGTTTNAPASRTRRATSERHTQPITPRRAEEPADSAPLIIGPAIAEARIVLKLFKIGVDGTELLTDPLDQCAHVGAIALLARAGAETFATDHVVNFAIRDVASSARGEQAYHLEFGERQFDALAAP